MGLFAFRLRLRRISSESGRGGPDHEAERNKQSNEVLHRKSPTQLATQVVARERYAGQKSADPRRSNAEAKRRCGEMHTLCLRRAKLMLAPSQVNRFVIRAAYAARSLRVLTGPVRVLGT